LSFSKIEGGRTLIILKSILSLRYNSGGKTIFRGGQNAPFAPPPRKIPVHMHLYLGKFVKNCSFL